MNLKSHFKSAIISCIIGYLILINTTVKAQIISHEINDTLIGNSSVTLDLDNNGNNDYQFEIITLTPGVLAARVITIAPSAVLDNSTFGYPDTLNEGSAVAGFFNQGTGVLGTFNNAGQFNGAGNKYLGIRLASSGLNLFGWIKINCSVNRDTLIIISCAWQTIEGTLINAGDGDPASVINKANNENRVYLSPNPCRSNTILTCDKTLYDANIDIFDDMGKSVMNLENLQGNYFPLHLPELPAGVYYLRLHVQGKLISNSKLIITP